MVYTSLQGDPRKDHPRTLLKSALRRLLEQAKGILFEVVFPTAGLEGIVNETKEGGIEHGEGLVEHYRMQINPVGEGFGWWTFEQILLDRNGNILARQRVYIPIPLNEEAFHELLEEISKELGKPIKIVDVRDRDSHKPPGKEYARWYLLTTEEVKAPYREVRVLERELASRK